MEFNLVRGLFIQRILTIFVVEKFRVIDFFFEFIDLRPLTQPYRI